MTKEQEEAIETMRHWIDFEKHNRDKINKADDLIKIQETVLSMLKQNSVEIAEKSAEIEKYKYLYQKALDNTIKADRENIQLKKQIDLMAETIRKLVISLANYKGSYDKEAINFTGNIKDIKQYFERKSNSSEQN